MRRGTAVCTCSKLFRDCGEVLRCGVSFLCSASPTMDRAEAHTRGEVSPTHYRWKVVPSRKCGIACRPSQCRDGFRPRWRFQTSTLPSSKQMAVAVSPRRDVARRRRDFCINAPPAEAFSCNTRLLLLLLQPSGDGSTRDHRPRLARDVRALTALAVRPTFASLQRALSTLSTPSPPGDHHPRGSSHSYRLFTVKKSRLQPCGVFRRNGGAYNLVHDGSSTDHGLHLTSLLDVTFSRDNHLPRRFKCSRVELRDFGCWMRVIEANMERRRNEGAGETGDPRENPPANGIVRHDSHLLKSGDPAGD
ncbi:hypothetical protein PR048_006484 [Dryococelus australis]|uniref:Uncharacterized protein n=1 Tax=Dryococelus australis TaxID=614101 RepID=A0ABQ9IB41_9NEOP|nr:hypothetical protein PR048_006484 [Dryococelus australis]